MRLTATMTAVRRSGRAKQQAGSYYEEAKKKLEVEEEVRYVSVLFFVFLARIFLSTMAAAAAEMDLLIDFLALVLLFHTHMVHYTHTYLCFYYS